MRKKLIYLSLVVVLVLAKIAFDRSGLVGEFVSVRKVELDKTHGEYLGFGLGINSGDMIYEEAFDELALEFVRMELGPLWHDVGELIPDGATVDELYQYVARNYNGDAPGRLEEAKNVHRFLKERGIQIVLVNFEVPYHWRVDEESGRLRTAYVDDLARFHTAHLLFLKDQGITIDYIELANEPDGHWNGHITPDDYATLVQECDALFANRKLDEVKILGPGLAFLNLHGRGPRYLESLGKGAFKSLDGWSTHTWDEVEFASSQPEYSYGVWKPFLDGIAAADPNRKKPLFLTEYGSDATLYGDTVYESPRDQVLDNLTDSWDYALRVMANTTSHLNRGAQALILYRLSNAYWHETGWGLLQPEGENSYRKKPVYHAVQNFMPHLPLQAQILQPTWYYKKDAVLCSILNDVEKKELTILAVNWTDQDESKKLKPQDVTLLEVLQKRGLQEASPFPPEVSIDGDRSLILFDLPPRSMASFTIKYREN